MTKKELRTIYDREHSQAGDTEMDFVNWAVDYLIEKQDKSFLKILKRHTKGIEKEIEKYEKE